MDIIGIAVLALAIGALAAYLTGQPLLILVGLVVGALMANRRGYRHQARAIRSELEGGSSTPTRHQFEAPPGERRQVEDRLREVERLRTAGTITDAEADARRAAILDDL